MSEVIDIDTRGPRPPGPPNLLRAFHRVGFHTAKADTLCIALREIIFAGPNVDERDELDRAAFNLVCDLFEQIGGIEQAWKETYAALWPE
jgi:hypothetical protein